jgi:hypothetical protein
MLGRWTLLCLVEAVVVAVLWLQLFRAANETTAPATEPTAQRGQGPAQLSAERSRPCRYLRGLLAAAPPR